MYSPTLEQARAYAADYKCVPVCRAILSDMRTPIEVLKVLKNVSKHCYLLESLASSDSWGRYTFLGYEPGLEITCVDGRVRITDNGQVTQQTRNIPAKSCVGSWRNTKARKLKVFPPSPAVWCATSPMILSNTPNPT